MSKAFTREDDSAPPPEPKAARRVGPRHLTARGRQRLLARAAVLRAEGAEAAGKTLTQQVEAAQVVPARAPDDDGPVRFGDVVTLRLEGGIRRFEIVSADEAELAPDASGDALLNANAPLARAVIGAEVGDLVVVDLPDGSELEAEVLAVAAPESVDPRRR